MMSEKNKLLKYFVKLSCFCLIVAYFSINFARAAIAADFDVLVNDSVTESSIKAAKLKQILLANAGSWVDGKKVVIVMLSPDAALADTVAESALGMTSLQEKKFYLTKVFSGVLPSTPSCGESSDEVAELVAKTPGAIAVVPKGTKPGKAKLLKVD